MTRATRNARESEVEQRFISLLAPEVQEIVRASSDIYQAFGKAIKDGHGGLSRADFRQGLSEHYQKLETMMAKNSGLQEAVYAKQAEAAELQKAMYAKQEDVERL